MLKFIYKILTFPILIIGFLLYKINFDNIKNDIDLCIRNINKKKNNIPDSWIIYLIYAEDHRFNYHYGIDYYSIIRSIYSTKIKKKFQGGSTIQQQYVRVITNRYERTLWRKIREQILAVMLNNKINKFDISKNYLSIAYYGTNQKGLNEYMRNKNISINDFNEDEILSLISKLKYPEPFIKSERWKEKINLRKLYILNRIKNIS